MAEVAGAAYQVCGTMANRLLMDLLATAVPLVVGGFLAGLFTYYFELRRTRNERAARRVVLLESLRRELAFVPEQLPAYRTGAVHLMPPIRTVVGAQLLDGQVLDWRGDELLIQPLLEFQSVAAIYNDLVAALNAAQSSQGWSEEMRSHWHGQLLGVHSSLLVTQRTLLTQLSAGKHEPLAETPADDAFGPLELDPAAGWRVDGAHSRVGFSAQHMGIITVLGHFERFGVQLALNPVDVSLSSVEARVDADSVRTGDSRRDADLRSAHFLDAAAFPWIVFVSTSVEVRSADHLLLAGDLTIRDITHPVSLEVILTEPVADRRGGRRRGFKASGSIDRTQWGLTWNVALETGGWLVSEQIKIELEIAAVAADAQSRIESTIC